MISPAHRLIALTGLAAATAVVGAALAAQPHPGGANRAAATAWATFAQGQWQTARLMTSKATLPRTRRFARATERLFRQATEQLRPVAAAAGQKAAIQPEGLQRWQILRSRLRNLDGATSDRDYLRAIAQADVRLRTRMARLATQLTSPALRAYTARWMRLTSRHLQATRQMWPRIAHGFSMESPTRGHMPPAGFPRPSSVQPPGRP
ncbi:MAG: DUF4142 domain-containing protein [Terriglobales bacterium]